MKHITLFLKWYVRFWEIPLCIDELSNHFTLWIDELSNYIKWVNEVSDITKC